MPISDMLSKVQDYLDSVLDAIPKSDEPENYIAALVVLDTDTNVFQFSSYSTGFKKLFREANLSDSLGAGLDMEDKGLLKYATSRFKYGANKTWGYAMNLITRQLFEVELNPPLAAKLAWTEVAREKAVPGTQLIEFARIALSRDDTIGEYLIMIPYSVTSSIEGLVLLCWIEKDLELKHLGGALEFFEREGLLLSAQQVMLTAKAEHARSTAYQRLARLVLHEDNGFNDTVDALRQTLSTLPQKLRAQGVDEKTIAIISSLGIDQKKVEFIGKRSESKRWLNKTLMLSNPLRQVGSRALYDRKSSLTKDIPKIIEQVIHALRAEGCLNVNVHFTHCAENEPDIQLDPMVIEHTLRNILKNSKMIGCDEREKQLVNVQIVVDAIEKGGRRFLRLIVEDDAGGLEHEDIPTLITTLTWSKYCDRKRDFSRGQRGNGIWLISRYVDSSGGQFFLRNVFESENKPLGVRYHLTFGLPNKRSAPAPQDSDITTDEID